MAAINFYAGGYGLAINNLNNSGLGFFGSSFGQSVPVGAWQQSTYITDGAGVNNGGQANNVQYVHPNSGVVQNGTIVNNLAIPNYQSTLNIRFTNNTPVRTQNAQLYLYDRVSTSNPPSGVTTAVCSIVHPDIVQNQNGSGNATWQYPAGSSYLSLSTLSNGQSFSPGTSGQSINGASTTDVQHDFYVNISASPNSIGSKTQYGLLVSLEYL